MSAPQVDRTIGGVLDRMDRQARLGRVALFGALGVEAMLMVVVVLVTDWSDGGQRLLVVVSILGYTIVVLGLAALAAHVSRVGARVVAALDPRDRG
jgi:formate-dependent nitrite reductase membrane component NrfD